MYLSESQFAESGCNMQGLQIFKNVPEAIAAGYEIAFPPIPDSEGFLRARIHTDAGWATALVRVANA